MMIEKNTSVAHRVATATATATATILIRSEASMLSNAIFVAFCGIRALLNARAFELIKKSQSHTSVQIVYSLDSEGCQAVFYGA